jgi:hypothetical protein
MSMDPETQTRWDAWCDGRIEKRVGQTRDALADPLGEFQKQNDNAIAKLRQEIRDQPPLFAAARAPHDSCW